MKCVLIPVVLSCFAIVKLADGAESTAANFQELNRCRWNLVFEDPCTRDWKRKWTLDGKKATITHSEKGMDFRAGPTWKDDASHAVLWTKPSFKGDLKIEYEYTRTDKEDRAVTILYVQATGSGDLPYATDIAKWAPLRKIPSMPTYWGNMNTYHISYAAFGASKDDPDGDYIRARRYLPGPKASLRGTDLEPDYFEAGLFNTGVPHKITIIKVKNELFMRVQNDERTVLCHWTNTSRPITEGRIGLRHMYTRAAQYHDFCVYELDSGD